MHPQDNANDTNQQQENIPHIIRVKHNRENPYVMINRSAANDPNLPLDTLGLWFRLMCRPDDWEIHVTELMKSCKCGRDKVNRMLGELIKNGYAHRYQERKDGRRKNLFGSNVWYIFEFKTSEEEIQKMFPQTGFPLTEVPSTDNPQLQNSDNLSSINTPIDRKNSDIYAPADAVAPKPSPSSLSDAKKKKNPPVPFRTVHLKERMASHPGYEQFKKLFDTPLVGVDDKNHEALVEKHGESVVDKAYRHLAEWKLSKAEVDPRAVKNHSDFFRLKKWVIKEILNNPQGTSGPSAKRKWAIGIDTAPADPKEKKPYAWGMKSEEREAQITAFYEKKVGKANAKRLGRMSCEEVDNLEKEMLQELDNKGNTDELGSL